MRDLAAKNVHWRYYDENFRFLRQKTLLPWDQIHWELWLQVHHMQKPAPVVSSAAHNNLKPPFPSGYCWKFHIGEKCSGCNVNHECFKCGSQHPANKCAFPRRTTSQTSNMSRSTTTTTAGSSKSVTPSRPVSSTVNTNQSR